MRIFDEGLRPLSPNCGLDPEVVAVRESPAMKRLQSIASAAVALVCLGTAVGSSALTLGRAQGVALVGQPLDVRFQIHWDGSEDVQAACLNAEVFYGDSQVEPARVSLTLDASADPGDRPGLVRVRATSPVNEPVVVVNLRTGCQVRSSKRYTLLADLPTQVVEPAPARATAQPVTVRSPTVPLIDTNAPGNSRLTPSPAADRGDSGRPIGTPAVPSAPRAVAPRKPRAAPVATPPATEQAVVTPRLPQPARGRAGARLKLDPLDLLLERDPVLRASGELLSAPAEDGGAKRAEAAALWRALNATPEQILREEVQAQRAAEELKSLYAITHANQKGLMDLVARVERADSERYANPLVYTLAVLCALSLAALVWLWQRVRYAAPAADWRHGMDAGDSLMAELAHARGAERRTAAPEAPPPPRTVAPGPAAPAGPGSAGAPPTAAPAAQREAVPAGGTLTEVDFDLDLIHSPDNTEFRDSLAADPWATPAAAAPSAWRTLDAPRLPSTGHTGAYGGIDFTVSQSPLRSIDTEELEDIRQQAEFFVSLGQREKAVDILTTRIAQCGESSPLLCLDLLRLYHELGREAEYEFMRTEFHHWFTGRVPVFADFGSEGRALDRYPQVMERITRLWPGPPVLAYIEDCLYHHSGTVAGQDFDLQAYRDLLLLHTVAKRIIRMADDSGEADAHIPDMVRIPARVQSALLGDVAGAERRASEQRSGASWRGAGSVRDMGDSDDPQADIETRGVPLGSMRVPPAADDATGDTPDPAPAKQGHLTDFNFLHLR